MKREKLESIFYLKKEIEMWTNELIEIEAQSEAKAQPTYVFGGRSSLTSDNTASQAIRRAEVKRNIERLLQECAKEVKAVTEYIECVDDPLLRQIIYLRCIRCESWNNVAAKVGGGNTADSVRMRFNRSFPKNK